MSAETPFSSPRPRIAWHVWVVATVALVWNAAGAYTIMMAQAGKLPNLALDEAAYYALQPLWFVVTTDIALLSAIAASAVLPLRSRAATALFAISLAAIVVTDVYDLLAGTSRAYVNNGAMIVTALIFIIAILELAYAWAISQGRTRR